MGEGRDVFLNDVSCFLPNGAVGNQEMEGILGMPNGVPSRTRRIILRQNGIRLRYYALDPATGRPTHTNAQLTAEAIRRLSPRPGFLPDDIEFLACGTSTPDQLLPGHGVMVQGELGMGPCEVHSLAGVCMSGANALKVAFMNVALGLSENAVASGSELASSFVRADFCGKPGRSGGADLVGRPALSFDADFLRWMLSDGAGAVFLAPAPLGDRPSFRIEWIESVSFAGALPTCMYAGGEKRPDGGLAGWRELVLDPAVSPREVMLIRQDVKVLEREILKTAVERTLPRVMARHSLEAEGVDWFLPHYSSEFFRPGLARHMRAIGLDIPQQRWFSNLSTRGNTGSASIFLILEEFFHSDRMKRGDSVLCFIPESGRFSMCYAMLKVV